MTTERHPDLEIYVKSRNLTAIEAWLSEQFTSLTNTLSQGNTHEYTLELNGQPLELMINERVVGKAWTSIWFKENETPWDTDLACALAAASQMDTQIRCIASGWEDGDEPDEWWKVENGEQEKINWRT